MKLLPIYKNKYDAAGFVETLVAMAITGIAGILLINVAIKTLSESVKNEINDEMTVLDGNINTGLQYLVENYRVGALGSENPIDTMIDTKGCFELNMNYQDVATATVTRACPYSYDTAKGIVDRSACQLNSQNKVFGYVCVLDGSDSEILSVDIVTGFSGCDGEGCSDYVNKEIYLLR